MCATLHRVWRHPNPSQVGLQGVDEITRAEGSGVAVVAGEIRRGALVALGGLRARTRRVVAAPPAAQAAPIALGALEARAATRPR